MERWLGWPEISVDARRGQGAPERRRLVAGLGGVASLLVSTPLSDSTLKVNEINVETFKGVVQLSGFVRSQADIDQAVKVARGVAGVKSVKNNMRIK